MTTDNGNVHTWAGNPIGPGTPAWEAGNDARDALVNCFKQVAPHVSGEDLDLKLDHLAESIKAEALENFRLQAA